MPELAWRVTNRIQAPGQPFGLESPEWHEGEPRPPGAGVDGQPHIHVVPKRAMCKVRFDVVVAGVMP